MDDSRLPAPTGQRTPSSRPHTQRPPIEWPVRHGQTQIPTDNERAAVIARHRLERVYKEEGEPNQTPAEPTIMNRSENHVIAPPVNQRTEQHTTTMRDEPYDWQRYHNAWQQYYHQYFYRYYAGWWQQQKGQIEAEAHQQATSQAHQHAQAVEPENEKVAKEIRHKIRTTVEKQSHRIKSSTHFKPLIAAFSVGGAFLLLNYNQVIVGAVKQYVTPGSIVTTPVIVEPNANAQVGPEPKIIIPKIGVEVPVVYDEPRVDEASYQKALERGVVRLGSTANPGTKGNVVIGGHSSNNVFNAGGYKYVFVNLKRLDVGDILYLNFNGKRYTYKITVAKKIISPTDVSALASTSKPTVTLFTCDPPGTNVNRLIVQAEQIDPSPSAATTNTNTPTATNASNPLPSVAPSLWDRIFR
ncbi:MAG TPA: sortase [Candidatus Saccharibacteria bacterium]|jgi:sortase A|nr:hypothetical protein [Patescibacteria group bacterium]HMS31566.1 sortase [Candidatus Saccharibacteria bacterium]